MTEQADIAYRAKREPRTYKSYRRNHRAVTVTAKQSEDDELGGPLDIDVSCSTVASPFSLNSILMKALKVFNENTITQYFL